MSTAETRVILIRHGETAWNSASKFQGHLDSDLTATGRAHAAALGRRLAPSPPCAMYSSDLGRARHTAELIASTTGNKIIFDERLRERALGIFQGYAKEEIAKLHPEEHARYYSGDPDYVVPGGQSVTGHFAIALKCLEEISAKHGGETIAIVTHGGVLSGMFRHVTGVPFGARRKYSLHNAAFNSFLFTPEKRAWTLETWGDTAHFAAEITS